MIMGVAMVTPVCLAAGFFFLCLRPLRSDLNTTSVLSVFPGRNIRQGCTGARSVRNSIVTQST